MVANIRIVSAALLASAALLVSGFAVPSANAQAMPAAVPVPFAVALAGNGTPGSTTCSSGIPATNGVSYGDGCPAATAGLSAPQGAAVDKYGNVYIADYSDRLVRVIYEGGANLAAAITAANSGYTISASASAPAPIPVVGDMYTLAGFGGTSTAALTVTTGGKYDCANYAASGQPQALNSLGDGCPAASAPIGPRDVTVDSDGNLFLTDYTNSRIRVFCVNCASNTMAAQLIESEESGVTPVNGAMYTIAGYAGGYRDGYIGFGNATTAETGVALLRSPTAVALSSSDDVFIADNLNNAVRVLYNGGTAAANILAAEGITPTKGYVYTIAGTGCVSAATNKTGSVTSANSCKTTTGTDTATLGNALGVDVAWTVYLDPNGNLYFSDSGNARIKVIYGGIAPPLTFPNSAYPTLQAGYAYTFAGQGTLTQSGVSPSQLILSDAQGVGGDSRGDIFFVDYATGLFYETYAQSGLAVIIGGGDAAASPAAGAACSGGSTGPIMTDAYYNGCPLTQVKLTNPRGPIVADAGGALYFGDSTGSFLRKFTYNPSFPATAIGSSSASQPYAFTFLSSQTLTSPSVLVQGASVAGFTDAGGDTCAASLVATGGGPGTTCVVNVAFTPQQPGPSSGAVTVNSADAVLGVALLSGTGTGAGLAVDPGTATTTGTSLVPEGIAVDGAGRVLVTDGASKSLLRYTAGVSATVASGFSEPSGVAVDGAGDIFVADSAANTVTALPITGSPFTLTSNVSSPHGLATDASGNLYIADTGNNRILVFAPGATLPSVAALTGLDAPQAVAVDADGNLYVADRTRVVELTTAGVQITLSSGSASGVAVDAAGNVLVAAGAMLTEYPASGSAPVTMSNALITPQALALDSAGNAYVADSGFTGYLELQRTAGYYKFTSSPANATINLTSIGNATLSSLSYSQSETTDFSLGASTTGGCGSALAAGSTCALDAGFNPSVAGTLTDDVVFSSNASNSSSITLTLTGATASQSTTTVLAVSSSTLVYGAINQLTATVSGTLSAPTSGTVNFYNGSTLLGSGSVGAGGIATYSFIPTVGSYSITAVFQQESGYLSSTSSGQSFSVTPATLTVTASNASKLYDQPNPALTYTIVGFVNGDTQATAVTGAPDESTTAVTNSSVGSYPITITQGTLYASNYVFTFVNGTLSITGATSQNITFSPLPNVTYGAAPITLMATASSTLAVSYTVTGPATLSGSILTITGAGTVTVVASQTGNDTYAAATPVTQSFTVAPAMLAVTAVNVSRVYGSVNPSLTYTITGFVNGDAQATATTGALSESTTATAASSVGSYPITIAQGTLSAVNYVFTFTNGTLSVTPATLTLTANNATRIYGAANPTFTGTLTGAVNGDQLTETFSTTATAASAPNTYPIVPGAVGANVGNYTLVVTNGTLTVTQATPVIQLSTSATSGYSDTTNITLTATLTSPTSGTPTGAVTFYAGSTSLGTAPLSGSTAVLTTMELPVGADSVTASYSGDMNFSAATSSSVLINIAPGFSVMPTTTALSFQSNYQEAQAILTINPGGRTDTLSFACSGLPAKLSCAFNPATLPLAGQTTPQTVQVLVSNATGTANLERHAQPGSLSKGTLALALLPLGAVCFFGSFRRRLHKFVLVVLLSLVITAALNGCGGSGSFNQSAGSYNFTVMVNSGSTTIETIPFTLNIP